MNVDKDKEVEREVSVGTLGLDCWNLWDWNGWQSVRNKDIFELWLKERF